MVKRLLVSILLLFLAVAGFSQSNESILMSLGLTEMSEAGKDTVVHYYRTAYEESFGYSQQLSVPLNLPQESTFLQSYFQNKLKAPDLQLMAEVWAKRQAAFREKTLVRAAVYEQALNCQRTQIDALHAGHVTTLNHFQEQIRSTLSAEQIAILATCYDHSMERLRAKRDQFLAFEAQQTQAITPAIYDYMAYGFELMERYPASYYYSLLRANNRRLSFVEELPLEDFFQAYAVFENELILLLDSGECRAHLAIPFYQSGERYQGKHTLRNALFYAYIHFLR